MRKPNQKRQEFPIRPEPGWMGSFTRNEALGAFRNGTPVVKAVSEEGDAHQVGALGTVLGSVNHPEIMQGTLFYFVEWVDRPRVACGVIGWKLKPANSES